MLKHIVEIYTLDITTVIVKYTIQNNSTGKTAHAQMSTSSNMGVYSITETSRRNSELTGNIRITDMCHHDRIVKDLRKQAMEEYHGKEQYELRMNES